MAEERLFTVFQLLVDGTCNFVRTKAPIDVAVEVFAKSVNCSGAWIGTIRKVVVTDGSNSVEWKYGEGISYPKTSTVN